MLGFTPFKRHANKFNYIPRYYDPEKEAREQRRAELRGERAEDGDREYRPGQYIRTQRDARAARAENQRYASVVYAHDKLCDLLLFSRGEGKSLACVAEESNAADPGIEEKVYFTLQAAAVDGVVLAKRGREDRAYAGQPLIYILHFLPFTCSQMNNT